MLNEVKTVYKFDQMLTMFVTCIVNMDVKVPRYHDSAPERRYDLEQTRQLTKELLRDWFTARPIYDNMYHRDRRRT